MESNLLLEQYSWYKKQQLANSALEANMLRQPLLLRSVISMFPKRRVHLPLWLSLCVPVRCPCPRRYVPYIQNAMCASPITIIYLF